MRECIEDGILQSYVDGELSAEMAERVSRHTAKCSACAEALNEAMSEMAMFSAAFDAEMSLEVPTVSLRERLDAAINEVNGYAETEERKPSWSLGGWLASFGDLFKVSPQRAAGFASLIAIVALAAILAVIYSRRSGTESGPQDSVATIKQPNPTASPAVVPSPSPSSVENGGNEGPKNDGSKARPKNQPAPKKQPKPVLVPQPDQLRQEDLAIKTPVEKPLPGEQNYLKAIDSLMTEIEASSTAEMKPSLRTEYERNLAVVDQAIDSTRRMARRNPKDPDAVQFLYSTYQSKLDLLSAVAEQVRPTIATR